MKQSNNFWGKKSQMRRTKKKTISKKNYLIMGIT